MKKKNFRLTKICEKDKKDHVFVSFCMFPFHGNIMFSELIYLFSIYLTLTIKLYFWHLEMRLVFHEK